MIMKIGVDGRMLCGPANGIKRFISEVGNKLNGLHCNIIFYTPQKIENIYDLNLKFDKNFEFKSKSSQQIWAQTILPALAVRDKVDLFWGPAHRLPYFLPKNIIQILTIHDLVWMHQPSTMQISNRILEQLFMPRSINQADKVVAISNSTGRDLLERFPSIGNKLSIIQLGATSFSSLVDFDVLRRFGINHKYILFVGTLEPRKNLTRLIEAYLSLPVQLLSQYELVVVGQNGWGNMEIKTYEKINPFYKNIKFLGYVSDKNLGALYKHAQFLAMPSLYEGYGLPIIEAMSMGVPVLTSNCSSMPEVAGDAGLFINPLSVESIRGGLKKLLIDHECRKILALKAIKNASKFSWGSSAQELLNLFEEALVLHRNN